MNAYFFHPLFCLDPTHVSHFIIPCLWIDEWLIYNIIDWKVNGKKGSHINIQYLSKILFSRVGVSGCFLGFMEPLDFREKCHRITKYFEI